MLYGHRLAEPLDSTHRATWRGTYAHIVAFRPRRTGKNVAPRLAALLDVMVISDVIGIVEGPDTFRAADLRRQRHPDGEIRRTATKIMTLRRGDVSRRSARTTPPALSRRLPAAEDPSRVGSGSRTRSQASDRPELASAADHRIGRARASGRRRISR